MVIIGVVENSGDRSGVVRVLLGWAHPAWVHCAQYLSLTQPVVRSDFAQPAPSDGDEEWGE